MNTVEGIGYLAASLVLATFCEIHGRTPRRGDRQQHGVHRLWLTWRRCFFCRALATDKHLPARGAAFAAYFETSEKRQDRQNSQ
jgi:hypothetical protein